jgi:DNA-3-methyladenine glycosylase
VYRSYGIHALLNAVCEGYDVGAAVLIRALEPLAGLEAMRERRGLSPAEDLCSGPGKLTQALGIGLVLNATSLQDGPVRLLPPAAGGWEEPALLAGPRIGISKAVDLPWRFCAAGSRSVSRPWPPGLRATLGGRPAPRPGA